MSGDTGMNLSPSLKPVVTAEFVGLGAIEAAAFAKRWLPAWSGNDPDRLIGFYSEDVYYRDPMVAGGILGRVRLAEHFKTLLARNPDWEWHHIHAVPLHNGFLGYWLMQFPDQPHLQPMYGISVVKLKDGLIYRNEIYFDRTAFYEKNQPRTAAG